MTGKSRNDHVADLGQTVADDPATTIAQTTAQNQSNEETDQEVEKFEKLQNFVGELVEEDDLLGSQDSTTLFGGLNMLLT